jgi:glutathione peroxidase
MASLPAAIDLRIDGSVAGFALLAATLAGIAFGLTPALHATRPDLIAVIGAGSVPTRARLGLRRVLVSGQIAASLVLVVAFDGTLVPLATFEGDVLLIVNVASECGLTPQYTQLQALHERFGDEGLVILGIPANNFGAQEPGSDAQIKSFCSSTYNVTFRLFSKVSVKGDDKCDLYKFLTDEKRNHGFGGEITWNFEKFLVGRAGNVIGRFDPRVSPDDPELVAAIEDELAKSPTEREYDGA